MKLSYKEFIEILNIGISLTTEKNKNLLLDRIITASMNITFADAGTLYSVEGNKLVFKIMKTESQGISKGVDGKKIDLPPVLLDQKNVCAYAAMHRCVVNIEDVQNNEMFDFSGPKKYDGLTGYKTKSMLVIPLIDNEDGVIGVLQLINALDAKGEIIKFDKEYEFIILSLAAQAAITLSNMKYTEELKEQMWSFTEALATAIDERTHYNATHTRKVAYYASKIADYLMEEYENGRYPEKFDQHRKEQLVMAALLHDIGKMIIPLEIMDKPSRLAKKMEAIKTRFKLFESYALIRKLRAETSEEEWQQENDFLRDTIQFVEKINEIDVLTESDLIKIHELAQATCKNTDGIKEPLFTPDEIECLQITKGTLTAAEREIMMNHVIMTKKILSKVHFNRYFKDCTRWAVSHHELLDGTGYPEHLSGNDLAIESRILAVVDIYDALVSKDRPYKEPVPQEMAFSILDRMVSEGKLDGKIVDILKNIIKQNKKS